MQRGPRRWLSWQTTEGKDGVFLPFSSVGLLMHHAARSRHRCIAWWGIGGRERKNGELEETKSRLAGRISTSSSYQADRAFSRLAILQPDERDLSPIAGLCRPFPRGLASESRTLPSAPTPRSVAMTFIFWRPTDHASRMLALCLTRL